MRFGTRAACIRRQGIAILIDAINQQQTVYPVIELGMLRPWLRDYDTSSRYVTICCRTCEVELQYGMQLDTLFYYLADSRSTTDRHQEFLTFMQDGICGHCKESIK